MARPLNDSHRRWLVEELDHWRSQGLVDAATGERILAEYESSAETSQRKRSIAQLTLMGIAASFVGLAVLLVVGYNWSDLGSLVKLTVIFTCVVGAHLLAMYLRFQVGWRGLSEVLYLLAVLFFGAGIVLIGDAFHLSGHPPDALWWWAVGAIPIALVLDTPLVHMLIVALLSVWTGLEIFEYRHRFFWFWSGIPNLTLSLPLLIIPGVAWSYRKQSKLALSLYLALAAWWVMLQAVAWDYDQYTILVVGMLGPIFLILAENHQPGERLAAPYRFWGMVLTGGTLIPLSYHSFHDHWWWGWRYRNQDQESLAILAAGIVWLAVMAACAVLLRPLGDDPQASSWARLQALGRRQWLPLAISAAMIFIGLFIATRTEDGTGGIISDAWVPTLLSNVAMVALSLWLIHVGLREERGRTFAAGVCYLMLWSVLRYFDLFSDVGGVLGAAALFLSCGVTLFGLALWWGRRKETSHA